MDTPFILLDGNRKGGLVLLCDHARNAIPPSYAGLGLPVEALTRHIAYDIGAEALSRHLALLSGAPLLMTTYSRLLIDPNRGEDDPTLIMRLSDGAIVLGNARLDASERARRLALFHRPYHQAIADLITHMSAEGPLPAVVSLHSFTPSWKGRLRPWQIGVLWDNDPRLAVPLIARLREAGDVTVGDNEPYDGALKNDTLYRHATARGLAHALIEVRQDLIASAPGARAYAERLWEALAPLLAQAPMHERMLHGSRTGDVIPCAGAEAKQGGFDARDRSSQAAYP